MREDKERLAAEVEVFFEGGLSGNETSSERLSGREEVVRVRAEDQREFAERKRRKQGYLQRGGKDKNRRAIIKDCRRIKAKAPRPQVIEKTIKLPGAQNTIVDTIVQDQLQTIEMGDRLANKAQIEIRALTMTPHRPGAKQPDLLHLGAVLQDVEQTLARRLRQARNCQQLIHGAPCSCRSRSSSRRRNCWKQSR